MSGLRIEPEPNNGREHSLQFLREASSAAGKCTTLIAAVDAKCQKIGEILSMLYWLHPFGVGQYRQLFARLQAAASRLRGSSVLCLNFDLSRHAVGSMEDMRELVGCSELANEFLKSHAEFCCAISALTEAKINGECNKLPGVGAPVILGSSVMLGNMGVASQIHLLPNWVPKARAVQVAVASLPIICWQVFVTRKIQQLSSLDRDLEPMLAKFEPLPIQRV